MKNIKTYMADKITCPYLAGALGKDPVYPAEMFYTPQRQKNH